MNIAFQDEDEKETSLAFQGVGDVTADQYVYLEGSAPRDHGEVGISHLIADRIGAHIGDTVTIQNGEAEGKYLVTAVFQTMNNLGEGIRFYEEENWITVIYSAALASSCGIRMSREGARENSASSCSKSCFQNTRSILLGSILMR